MFSFFRRTDLVVEQRQRIASPFLILGLLSLLFGLAVFAAPELLAYLVASFFVIIGISLIATWMNLRR